MVLELELYTRSICSDCQDAKNYLAAEGIQYKHKDVGKNLSLEEDLKKISGARIVPFFAFYKKGLFGKRKLMKYFIGFENNKDEILSLVDK
ncbi:glutaredoxin family protein [Desemzia sp. RIT804]|uniref:glutaredoxin family protein n=1 Tax=Desemzia sp. RIT 804 TaxID=2810209 RepID=UPI00194E9B56|nr:glutaredoxin family protein [Desemzia sp. RIT 804]MBM6614959.1 glutaredoxin family protein [Desemzia sp. RIT 804]